MQTHTIKFSGLLIAASLLAALAGCSGHPNPLKTAEPKDSAKFLVHASQAAEKKLNLFNPPGGYYYGHCMQGKAQKAVCDKLYPAMVEYAKTTEAFKSITVKDLKNPTVFKSLKDDYERERFNAI